MSALIPIAKTAKKIIPKSKKGKIAGAAAAAFGISAVRDKNEKPTESTTVTPSQDAQNQNAPITGSTDNKGLLGLPIGTPIRAGVSETTSGGFSGIPSGSTFAPSYTTASANKGDAEKFLASQSIAEKAALLLRLGQVPNLYPSGQAPTPAYVQSMGNRIIWRPADATALEGILGIQDQLGDPTPNATLSNLISNPVLASKYFGTVTTKAKAVTPLAAIEAELNDKFLDLFETQADAKLIKSYAKEVNALEASPAGITAQQKEDILLRYIQKKANEVYNLSETGLTPGAIDKGSLGRVVRSIRSAYDDNGIPTNEKDIYNKAVQSLRSADAYKNVLDGVAMQASTVMPAFKDLFAQGKNAKEVLSPWINTRAQVLGIPADQIKVSDMYEIGSGPTPLSIQDYKKQLYRSPEFKNTDAYKQRSLGDMQTLLRAFNIG
jgi:hypothetical protein